MTDYQILQGADGRKAIKCNCCGLTSYHSEDVKQRYCGKCRIFHEDLQHSTDLFDQMLLEALGVPEDLVTGEVSYSTTRPTLDRLDRKA